MDHARGIHALEPVGERFVLMTRGACASPTDPGKPYCSAYLGLDGSLRAGGPQRVLAHTNQPRAAARLSLGGVLHVVLVMETRIDAAGLSAPTFDTEVLRVSFDSSGALDVARSDVAEPGEYGEDELSAALSACADGRSACGAVCASGSNRCAPIGLGSGLFRNPIAGGAPQSLACDGDGCDFVFRRGPTVRAMHLAPEGGATAAEVPATSGVAPLTARMDAGRFTRRDPSGAIVGEPLEVSPRDTRASVTWTGTGFLAASAWGRGGTTRYSVAAISCDGAAGY